MDSTSAATATVLAVVFVWLGMVLAISFLEAPLKFRAPGVTIPIGLAIGRLVFRALNAIEAVLAVVVIIAVAVGNATTSVDVLTACTAAVLAVQLAAVRPMLTRRSDQVLAGGDSTSRSHAHLYYVAFEVAKVALLIALGISVLP